VTGSNDHRQNWYRAVRTFWNHPDDLLVAAGANGELVVAKLRLFVTAFLVVVPVFRIMTGDRALEAGIGLSIGGAAFLMALGFLLLARSEQYRPWLGFVTSLADVTLITTTLVVFLVADQPHAAVNSKVVFPTYFLAIAATSLRYDARTSVVAGTAAVVQYLAVLTWAAANYNLNDPIYAPYAYGMFSWIAQMSRVVLLGSAAFIATMIVLRTQRLRWLSASDPLTQLMNRGFFDERMEEEEIRARRYERPLALAMIDIDRFKQFNDTYGHASGDEALRVVSRAIRTCVRRTDLVARYGGEEFMVAFLETDGDSAAQKAEDIRRAVMAQRVMLKGSRGVTNVTVSIGIAVWPRDADTLRSVIEKADRRLYAAKEAGRNRVVGPTDIVAPAG
jgi:diguanylate cyclase (GGDEF)-like protein